MHRIHVEREPGTTVVRAEGELDAFAAPEITAAVEQLVGTTRVIADLGAVSFLDSTALGLLVRAVRELGELGAEVRVVLPTGAARRIFEITTLDRVLPIAASREDAVAELSRAQDGGSARADPPNAWAMVLKASAAAAKRPPLGSRDEGSALADPSSCA